MEKPVRETDTRGFKRRAFTKEFNAHAVRIVRESGKSVGTVARELDLTETAPRSWVRQGAVDAGRDATLALYSSTTIWAGHFTPSPGIAEGPVIARGEPDFDRRASLPARVGDASADQHDHHYRFPTTFRARVIDLSLTLFPS
jgi:hypothetical protein